MADPLTAKQRDIIAKMLGMAGSSNQHEALGHFLKAKAILDKSSETWLDLFTGGTDDLFMHARSEAHRYGAENRKLGTELAAALTELTKARANIEKLKAARSAPNYARARELDAAKTKIAALEQDNAEMRAKLDALTPKPDPWQARLEAALAADAPIDRWTAVELLKGMGVPERAVTTDTYRRLSRVMKSIGGWKPSNNVYDENTKTRVRGYVRDFDI